MKKYLFLFLIITVSAQAQELMLKKAAVQTIKKGNSPASSTIYIVLVSKEKKGKWGIDSVNAISSGQKIKYDVVKTNNADAASPEYEKVKSNSDLDKGNYQIAFGVMNERGNDRPVFSLYLPADTTTLNGGVIIYYTVKRKPKQLKINLFERKETVEGP